MKTINYANIAVTLTVAGLAASPGAWAAPIMDATAYGGSSSPMNVTSATSANASVINLDNRDEGYEGQGAADSAGNLGVSAAFLGGAGGNLITVGASATWTETFDYLSGPATFDFFIPGAAIGFEANNVSGLMGSFLVEILLNGSSIFNAGATVTTTSLTPRVETDLSLMQTGTSLTPIFATDIAPPFGEPFGLGSAGYRFGPFSGSLALNPLVGITNEIVYRMSAEVTGNPGETSAIASIGDPLNLNQQNPGVTLSGVTPTTDHHPVSVSVPEPTTLSLLGAGLLAIGLRRRRRVSA